MISRKIISRFIRLFLVFAAILIFTTGSVHVPATVIERIQIQTREQEFDYVGWMANALYIKLKQLALGTGDYLSDSTRHEMMLEYLELIARIQQGEAILTAIYADPTIDDPVEASAAIRQELDALYARRASLEPLAESILESQIATAAAEMGLTLGGQPIPPVLYHSTPLPLALIISPREVIRQDADISLVPGIPIDERAALESLIDRDYNVSSLVVNIGGVGVYPTMVYETSYLEGLAETVAHEWVHNFLTLRPLGASYLSSIELRIMNETTAAIAGNEIGRAVLEAYYPELIPPPPVEEIPPAEEAPPPSPAPPVFDFYQEMRITREQVDHLLAAGKIEEAEEYMEARRVVFWDNGYRHLRKLNQAYFAFHGAYADHPSGGAAGADPVGAAVRALRAQSPSLAAFLNRISWMSSFEQLQRAVETAEAGSAAGSEAASQMP